jgi:hypothetical protein
MCVRAMSRLGAAALAIGLTASGGLSAFYSQPDLEQVPIARVIASLTRLVEASPNDATLRLNLGRAHAMAWARGEEPVDVRRGTDALFFGFEPAHVPITAPRPPATSPAARQHLERAIEQHRRASQLEPGDLTILLGYAWCLDQAGRDAEAVPLYRRVIAEGWKREANLTALGLGAHSYTMEAGGYLRPHLDATKDAAEIAELRARSEKLIALPRSITPIVVPLDDETTAGQIVDRSARVRFDLDGSGRNLAWQWITPQFGWLVYDRTGSGRIGSALQLFGNVTFWMFWENGYRALATLDDDGDGEVAGFELRGLALWVDADANGRSDAGEVRALPDHGIVAVSCAFTRGAAPHVVAMSTRGVRLTDGRVRPTYDVVLESAAPEIQLTSLVRKPRG